MRNVLVFWGQITGSDAETKRLVDTNLFNYLSLDWFETPTDILL